LRYSRLAETYEKIESTTKRLEMTDYLVELLKETPKEIIDKVVYLTQGKIYPDFVGLEIGVAEKLAIKAIARAAGKREKEIEEDLKTSGDIGETAQKFMAKKAQATLFQQPLTVEKVYQTLEKMAKTVGAGSMDMKLSLLAGLLTAATSKEAKYLILEKLGGKCIAEYKYDGERIQTHKDGEKITLFSRRLENISDQYPDAIQLIRQSVKAQTAILEAECVAIDPDTGEMLPFQELMHRRRKYGIAKAMEEYPIALYFFDLLYLNGKDLTLQPYPVRRRNLEAVIQQTERIRIAEYIITDNPEELEKFFLKAIEEGCEGLLCKSIAGDSIYQAGARGWQWIKYKRDYKSEMTDTVDLVVVGAFHGRGRRAGTYGALLLAAYDSEEDSFKTVCKCGSGFTDEDLEKLPKKMKKHQILKKHPRVISTIKADVWFEPKQVIEVIGAEITLSPVHTCALNIIREGSGLAIRFPRFTGNYRPDKAAEDATTVKEIIEMYQRQLKKFE